MTVTTYEVKLDTRDANRFLNLLEDAAEENELEHPFNVELKDYNKDGS